jgi:hypothetical protein
MNRVMKTVLTLTAMLAAGCSDGTMAPKSAAPEANVSGGGSTAALTGSDTLRFSFVIDPARNISYNLGAGNSIVFPQGSLCDPYTSSYGPTEWDAPCSVASAPLVENAKAWLDAKGHPHIDFNPAIRFVPSMNPLKWVKISFTDYSASWYASSSILYCAQVGTACTDESKLDPTMLTVRDPISGRLTRRIKHFSGYSITTGAECYDTSDPDCVDNGRGFNKIKINGN